MWKVLSFIASFLFGKKFISIPYEVIVDYAIARVRLLAQSAALGFAGIVLILTGFLVSFFNLLSNFDQKGYFAMSAVASGGLSILLIGVIVLLFASFKKSVSLVRPSDVLTQQVHSPLEEALATLITDFARSRKEKADAEQATEQSMDTTREPHHS
jgi:hypothetical protein